MAPARTAPGRTERAPGIIALALVLLGWLGVASLGPWPSWILPGPGQVARSLGSGLRDGSFTQGVLLSLRRLLIGYGCSTAAGIALGMLLGRVRLLRAALGPMVVGLQALPSICWLPLALLWFGLSETAILFVVVMGSLLSITIATEGAVRSVPPLFIRAARTMGSRGLRLYTRVILPASLPGIVTGLKLGWTFAWRSLMAAELLYVAGGIGQLLTLGRELNDMARVMAVMLVIVVLGLLFERLILGGLERHLRERWGHDLAS